MRYLAFDIGGTAIKHAVVDDRYRLRAQGEFPTASVRTPDELVAALGAVYDRHAAEVAGVAISTAGETDPATGLMFNGGALRFTRGLEMRSAVAARCPTRVTVENDANCALLAEVGDGVLTGCRNALALIVGTALGGAVLVDGRLHHGTHFYAGSFSLLMRTIEEPFSAERIGGTLGVGALTAAVAAATGRDPATVDGRVVFDLVEAGDAAATAALDAYCAVLARLLFNAQMLLDVEAVAVGGGISRRPAFVAALAAQAAATFDAADTLVPVPRPAIRGCRHSADANLVGAVVHHLGRERPPVSPGSRT
nr:ROK family protein [Propionibacterium sp.]